MPNIVEFDPELEAVLPGLRGYVPLGMTLKDLPHFRRLSNISRDAFIGDRQVRCNDHFAPLPDGSRICISVLSNGEKPHPSPCVYFLHGGGMVMGSRFAGASILLDWVEKLVWFASPLSTGSRPSIRERFL